MENAGQQHFQTSEHKSNVLTLCRGTAPAFQELTVGKEQGRKITHVHNDYNTAEGK